MINPLSTNPAKGFNTLKQFVDNLPANCLTMFDDFVGLVLKWFKLLWYEFHAYFNIYRARKKVGFWQIWKVLTAWHAFYYPNKKPILMETTTVLYKKGTIHLVRTQKFQKN